MTWHGWVRVAAVVVLAVPTGIALGVLVTALLVV